MGRGYGSATRTLVSPMSALLLALLLLRHPIHSSSAVLTVEPGSGTASVTLRVFADDFPPGSDSAAAVRYLASRFLILDRQGRQLPLTVDQVRQDGVVLLLMLSVPAPGDLAGGRIWHGVLAEKYADQVNLVQVHRGSASGTLLFSPHAGAKPLP